MSLSDWLARGWLERHRPDSRETRELLAIADRDITDAQVEGLSCDSRLSIAYNAALQLATAALAASGFRPGREAHHYRAVQSLGFTVGVSPDLVDQLDGFRRKRNISDYERAGSVSEHDAREMLELARTLRETVEVWLRASHPELM